MDILVESKATLKTPAYAAKAAKAELAPWSIVRREPGPHDVLIDILYCGVCHSDIPGARRMGRLHLPHGAGTRDRGPGRQGRR